MDEATYWELQNAISAARTLAELEQLSEQLRQWPLDERRRQLNEVLFMQERMLQAAQARAVDSGAA
jgi:hypothetical protein